MLPHAPRRANALRHAFLVFVVLLSSDVHAKKPRSKQLEFICKEPRSHGCIKWDTTKYSKEIVIGDILPPNSEYKKWCGLSDLRPLPPHKKYIKVRPFQENKTFGMIYCKIATIKNGRNLSLISIKRELAVLKRNTRQAVFPPRGRYRGQTQSQYLSIDHGNGKGEGKAEAHSAADSSSASVSGNNGMGQAQSQSIYDPNCDDCLGRADQDSQYLKKPTSAVGGNGGSHPGPGTYPAQSGNTGSGGSYPGQSGTTSLGGRPGISTGPSSPGGYPINSIGSGGRYPGQSGALGPSGYPGNSGTGSSNGYPRQTGTSGGDKYPGQAGIEAPGRYPNQNGPSETGRGYPGQSGTTGTGGSYPGQGSSTTGTGVGYPGQGGTTGAGGSYPGQSGISGTGGNYPGQVGNTGIGGSNPGQSGTTGTSGSYPGQYGSPVAGGNYPGQGGTTGTSGTYPGQMGTTGTSGSYPNQGGNSGTVGIYPGQGGTTGTGGSYPGQGSNTGTGVSYPGPGGTTGMGGNYPGPGDTTGTGGNYPGQGGTTGTSGTYPGQMGTTGTSGSYPNQGGNSGTVGIYPGQGGTTGTGGSYPGQGSNTGTGVSYLGPGGTTGMGGNYPGPGDTTGTGGSYPGHGGNSGPSGGKYPNQRGSSVGYPGQGGTNTAGGNYPGQRGIYPGQGGTSPGGGYPGQYEGTRLGQGGTHESGPGGNYPSQGTGSVTYPNQGINLNGNQPIQSIPVGNLSNRPNQGNGVSSNGQGPNTWPFLTGKFPDGSYYCCVVAPNGKPQGFGSGIRMPTNSGYGGSSVPPNNLVGPAGTGHANNPAANGLGGIGDQGSSTSPTGFNQGLNPNQGFLSGGGQNDADKGTYPYPIGTSNVYPGPGGTGFNPNVGGRGGSYPGKGIEISSYPNQGNTRGNFPGQSGVGEVGSGSYPNQGGTGGTYPGQTETSGTGSISYPNQVGTGGTYPGQTGISGTGGPYPGQTGISGPGSGSYPNLGGTGGAYPGQTGISGIGSTYPGQTGVRGTGSSSYPNQIGTGGTYPGQTGISGTGDPYPGQTGISDTVVGSYPNQGGTAGTYPGQTGISGTGSGSYPNQGGTAGTYPGQTGVSGKGATYPGRTDVSGPGSVTYPNQVGTGVTFPGQAGISVTGSGSYPNQAGTGGINNPGQTGGDVIGGSTYPGGTIGAYPSQVGTGYTGQNYPGTHGVKAGNAGPYPGSIGGDGGAYPNQVTSFPNRGMESGVRPYPDSPNVQTGGNTPNVFGPNSGVQYGTPTGLGPGINQQGTGGQNGYNTPGGSGTQTGYDNQGIPGVGSQFNGAPQNVLDPNSVASIDDDSEALASVAQADNGTTANASSKGGNAKGRAQTNVQGTYSGSGSFSAQAQISDENKAAESEVTGGKKGASSKAQGSGRSNKSQASVQLGSETGSIQTNSQSDGNNHFSNSQVQGSLKGGMADSQARGPGITSSQAQIGFTPYKQGDKSHDLFKNPFIGSGTASAQSSGRVGQSQSQLHGTFKYGITYNGAAQAGASLDKDTVLPNRIAFNKIDVFDEKEKNINVNIPNEEKAPNITDSDRIPNLAETSTENTEVLKNSETKYSSHMHADHHMTEDTPSQTTAPVGGKRSFQHNYGTNNADYEYKTEKEDNDDYDPTIPDNTDIEQGEYYDDLDTTHQSLQNGNRKKGLDVKQNTGGNSQHIVLDSLKSQDAFITQRSSQRHDESRVYQPGERVPGTGGYTIPIGFTGSVKSVASKDSTYVIGSKDSPSQAQSVSLKPGVGKVRYSYPSSYPKNVPSKDLRSLHDSKSDTNRYVSVSKSVTRDLDNRNNIQKQYSHTYYTKASSCGFFTFTCTIVSGPDGRKKICKPKIPTKPDGTPMKC